MMTLKIPPRFKRVTEAFDKATKARGMCESSGSEHSAADQSSADNLSDLVASFMEKEGNVMELEADIDKCDVEDNISEANDSETVDTLRDLLGNSIARDGTKEMIRREVELACRLIGNKYEYVSEGFKRELVSRLREGGFDAGLCKSRWQKTGHRPAGDYQYVDVIDASGDRYVVEVHLAASFEIARPTEQFVSILALFPFVFVGRPEELKQLVRIMCGAMKRSMKRSELSMPPWRRNAYMQSKWFGSYKRTTNRTSSTGKSSENNKNIHGVGSVDAWLAKKSTGFVALPRVPYRCRDDCSANTRLRIGQLTAAFCQNSQA